jgi:pyruvate/2-oxoglutarate dehydrogenase complex dihydrolipoamide acyltransferase (E2) component
VTAISFKQGDVIKTGSTLLFIDVPSSVDTAAAPSASTPSAVEQPPAVPAASPQGVVKPFQLTDIGEGIAEVELLQVYVKPGDTVQQYDRLVEVQSDKVCFFSSPVCVCCSEPTCRRQLWTFRLRSRASCMKSCLRRAILLRQAARS